MTQTSGRFFDELGKLLTDAVGAADGVRQEVESVMRGQAERVLNELDVVQREEFEAVKAMAQKAREENETLKARIAVLESKLAVDNPGECLAQSRVESPIHPQISRSIHSNSALRDSGAVLRADSPGYN